MALYATTTETGNFAAQIGRQSEWAALSSEQKNRCVFDATRDVIAYHGQESDILWLSADSRLNQAAMIQALYIGRTFSQIEHSERVSQFSDSSVSDGSVNATARSRRKVHPDAQVLISHVMRENYVDKGVLRG